MTDLPTLSTDQLAAVTGGFDIGGLVSGITGMIDKFTGGKYDVQGKAGQIMGLISSFKGGQQGAPQG